MKLKWICESCGYTDPTRPTPKVKHSKSNICKKCNKNTLYLVEMFGKEYFNFVGH